VTLKISHSVRRREDLNELESQLYCHKSGFDVEAARSNLMSGEAGTWERMSSSRVNTVNCECLTSYTSQ
jgi:hypothetical protein